MPLRPLRGRKIILKLERAGFVWRRQRGSHARNVHPDGRGVTVPMHPGDVPVPVIRSIPAQTGLHEDEWNRL